jgi:hypothetical protein
MIREPRYMLGKFRTLRFAKILISARRTGRNMRFIRPWLA